MHFSFISRMIIRASFFIRSKSNCIFLSHGEMFPDRTFSFQLELILRFFPNCVLTLCLVNSYAPRTKETERTTKRATTARMRERIIGHDLLHLASIAWASQIRVYECKRTHKMVQKPCRVIAKFFLEKSFSHTLTIVATEQKSSLWLRCGVFFWIFLSV